jgi:hypothetical protein
VIIKGTVQTSINTLLKEHATHFEIGGYGLDFSQISAPVIADDTYFTMFMNGTFYSE